MTTYKATAAGVTIRFDEGANISWFVDMAIAKGAIVKIERVYECDESELVSTILPTN